MIPKDVTLFSKPAKTTGETRNVDKRASVKRGRWQSNQSSALCTWLFHLFRSLGRMYV